MEYLVVFPLGLFAGTVGGVVGTGSSLILMPALVWLFGPQQAVPVMAIGAVFGNLGRVLAWWRDVDCRACAAYCSTAVPGAVWGVHTLLTIPAGAAEAALGSFFLLLVPARRWLLARSITISLAHLAHLAHLALLGGPLGFLTGMVVSTGPLTVPLFTFHGLERGVFLATEAAGSIGVYLAKLATFRGFDALPPAVIVHGLVTGAALMAGAFIGKSVVLRLSPAFYRYLIDALMLASGIVLLLIAVR